MTYFPEARPARDSAPGFGSASFVPLSTTGALEPSGPVTAHEEPECAPPSAARTVQDSEPEVSLPDGAAEDGAAEEVPAEGVLGVDMRD